ncbi:MAG: Hsp20/alpha crystallin family protein [Actinobacteria bacterium]|nr:Hsp20/alpha crystallin family protein [Actinomycetota bacterium]NIS34667.1 Hsp20/alpha crystallin family protein [Actinomycetota bacterium]NIT97662.1 Hsp20/alpha crystallin family protein [Actinomycetota bacterium]NIU21312.1 Hsp20/alpha crystallin family protein [Actinomycetota bacterium]NIU69427.1 Hsp20/alpha crystallin family protein [Actinomycetota bacterium]
MGTTETLEEGAAPDLTSDTPATTPRLFQDLFDRWAEGLASRLPEPFGHTIRIEESVDDDGVTLRAEIPGVDPESDVEITVDKGRLHISAERRSETEEEDDGRVRSEFRYGSYRRTLTLPGGAATDDITATYDDGILEVRIPVDSAGTETARIPITKSS